MPSCRSPRERALWRLAGALVLLIYASAYFAQFPLVWLRDQGYLRLTVAVAFALVALPLGAWAVRQRPGWRELLLYLGAAALYGWLFRHLTIIQERIHLLEYGAIGGLAYAALGERRRALAALLGGGGAGFAAWWERRPGLAATLLAAAAGWGDELVQACLPNRTYDLRDVGTNALAGALLVAVLAARRRLRERAGRGPGAAGVAPHPPAASDGAMPPRH